MRAAVRILAAHELARGFGFKQSTYLYLVATVLKKSPTGAVLSTLTDAEVMEMVQAPLRYLGTDGCEESLRKARGRVQLRRCACCAKQEDAVRTFDMCRRCNGVFYCGESTAATPTDVIHVAARIIQYPGKGSTGTLLLAGRDCQKKDWKMHKKVCKKPD